MPEPIYLDTPEGRELLAASKVKEAFSALAATFECQQTQTLCGVASSVTVLNALPGFAAPVEPIYYPYPMFTQRNFFSEAVSEIKAMNSVLSNGMTLEQLAAALEAHGASVQAVHAADTTAAAFGERACELLGEVDRFLIANFHRPELGQVGGGHFSPLAAYQGDGPGARVLMLDVARYKYRPAWVTVEDMFAAMDTEDSDSEQSRGYLVVRS